MTRLGRALLRRRTLALAAIALCLASALAAEMSDDASVDAAAWAALRDGGIVLFRHAHAPGGGDPAGFKLGDCSTQRNLDETGRAQARRIGDRLRQERIPVGAVLSSQWCRARETVELMAIGPIREAPAFNSFFDDRSREPAQTAAVRSLLLGWRGPGALVVATHHVNIMALTGIAPQSGEGIVMRRQDGQLVVAGRISP